MKGGDTHHNVFLGFAHVGRGLSRNFSSGALFIYLLGRLFCELLTHHRTQNRTPCLAYTARMKAAGGEGVGVGLFGNEMGGGLHCV